MCGTVVFCGRIRIWRAVPAILISLLLAGGVQAQEVVPNLLRCAPEAEDFAPGEVFARYEGRNRRLILVSATSGRVVREIETSLDVSGFEVRGWSPDCRYLMAYLGVDDVRDTVVWDVIARERVGLLENSWSLIPEVWWSPDDEWVVLQTLRRGGWLWHLPTNTQMQLTDQIDMMGRSFLRVEWDDAQNLLLVVIADRRDEIAGYDLAALRLQVAPADEPDVTPAGS